MELSRIRELLSGYKAELKGKVKLEPLFNNNENVNPPGGNILKSPDKLFKSVNKTGAMPNMSFLSGSDGSKLINPNTRVLHIGDSHTVGIYGHEMDKMMRETGAKVYTAGSSGSSPSSWLNGYVTKCGFFSKDENGIDTSPKNWKTPTKTPNLNDLISKFKPNVIVFSLGANQLGSSGETIEKNVRKVCEIAKASGAKIVWVGPPDGRPDKKSEDKQNFLYEHIQKIASEYGVFVDSRPFTDYPANAGGDGVHYWGGKLGQTAKNWSKQVFDQIQNSN